VKKQKQWPQMIIHQAHSGKELCRNIVKPLTMMTTQYHDQTVFTQLTTSTAREERKTKETVVPLYISPLDSTSIKQIRKKMGFILYEE
jgi:hypothetical protein